MQISLPSIIRVIACVFAIAAFVMPANIAVPSAVSADPGIMKWDTVPTPGSVASRFDILNTHSPVGADNPRGSEILDMSAGNDGKSIDAVVRTWRIATGAYTNDLLYSRDAGISWYNNSTKVIDALPGNVFQVVSAAGDPRTMVATTGTTIGPKRVHVSTNGGQSWSTVFDGTGLTADETIRCIDVSVDYGGKRDIAWGTVNGAGAGENGGRWMVRSSGNFSSTVVQLNANGVAGDALGSGATTSGIDYEAIKFSPTYSGDGSVALVYADTVATYYNVAFRDLNANTTLQYAFDITGVEVKNPASAAGASPGWAQLNNVELQLPSDFSGQSSSLRRAYISLDAYGSGGLPPAAKLALNQDGIFRIDDSTLYVLMDTSSITDKSIYSIAYYGTYASGKLLAGERTGFPCTATVPTWFTDSPTTCPIPCWYPALKPTTGAADQGTCSNGSKSGMGAALVDWNADGSLALVATGSLPATVYALQPGSNAGGPVVTVADKAQWYQMQYWNAVPNDESAFAISRNNGETFNQLSLIDTTIDWFNDVAVAPDCTTIYLASVNRNLGGGGGLLGGCNEFDSVWRATINPNVAAPLPAVPSLGYYWERVFTHTTSGSCAVVQTDLPLLRVVPSCTDKKDGEIVGWAAQGATATAVATSAGVMAWSPDFGDYWAMISPRFAVQDFAFESSTTLFVLNAGGLVQRLPYTGTSWSTNLPSYDTALAAAHTIVAVPDGKVLVGGAVGSVYPSAYSADKGISFGSSSGYIIAGHGNEHVIFDVDFKNNSFYYMGDDSAVGAAALGTVYRNTLPSSTQWVDGDMMDPANGGVYIFAGVPAPLIQWPAGSFPPHRVGQFGLAQAWTGEPQPALYAAHNILVLGNTAIPAVLTDSAVCRTLVPRNGMPKPGITWDCLDRFAPSIQQGVAFTLEPTSLKYCGCCTLDTNTTLYAIDDERGATMNGRWDDHRNGVPTWNIAFPGYTPDFRQGMLWAYTDCLAKKGPILKSPADKFLVGADPVTGRNQQIDLAWEQLCLSTIYQLQVAKDAAFTLRINPAMNNQWGAVTAVTGSMLLEMDSTNMTSPAAWIAPGALPEAGAIYYWRIRSAQSATGQVAASPWSEVRSFTVKAGFIVNTPYYGVQLLAPNNGCTGCRVKPLSFSWSPWKATTKYQLDLSKDSEFKQLVVTATTTTSGYEYKNALEYSTNYFWRVKALEVNGLNIPSDWSATFSFTTAPVPTIPPPPEQEPAIPVWVWVLMAIGTILVIAVLFLVFKTRRF